MRVAIIGAGPAGMTTALQLCRGGAEVCVYEVSPHVGGLSRSLDLWGHRVDMGPHRFFSTDARVNGLWLDVVGRDYAMVDRMTRILYQDRFFPYPLHPLETLQKIGLQDAISCTLSYVKQRLLPDQPEIKPESFESWSVRRFGRKLHETFFKSYSEKLWGIPCDELSADFAAQRINTFSLPEAILSAVSPSRAKQHKTLVETFAYPLSGTGSVYEKMADQVRQAGGSLAMQSSVRRIVHDEFEVTGIETESSGIESFDRVVSTMPITTLVRGLSNVPPEVIHSTEQLQFRNTVLVFLHVDSTELFNDQWLYIHDPKVQMGRVTNFRNWVPQLHGAQNTSVIACEFWCNDNDFTWQAPDADLIEQASHELRATGLIKGEPVTGNTVLGGHVERLPKCYPVYRRGYQAHIDQISQYLKQFSRLIPIGRYGAFKYNNQDHSILMGILAAENILSGTDHDLWSVNSDFAQYHERATIAADGLVTQSSSGDRSFAIA